MEPISQGMSGAAVEDIQQRLCALSYHIDEKELTDKYFGDTTACACEAFRHDHALVADNTIDSAAWSCLVDETYQLGDRTLYLRLPNFHGADVRELQNILNILGFSAGTTDGYYGPCTEAAVKQFQENIGLFADGMAFDDTFDALIRLHHVWEGKSAEQTHLNTSMGFVRAASALENMKIAITGSDQIARNVAGRLHNLAIATSEQAGIHLIDNPDAYDSQDTCVLLISSEQAQQADTIPNVVAANSEETSQRLRTAFEASKQKTPQIRIELTLPKEKKQRFTIQDAQGTAVMLLDAICAAFNF